MNRVILYESTWSSILWDYEGSYARVEYDGINDALFANLMGWA